MGKYKLETQLFCLYFSPVVVVTFLSFGFYVILFEQLKSIVNNQEEQIYIEQQTSKKQILLGLKSHLDQSFFLQSQEYVTLSRFITRLYEDKISLDSGFVEPILNLERFYQNKEDPALISLYEKSSILTSVWVKEEVLYFDDLTADQKVQLKKAAIMDVLIRSFNLLNVERTFKYKNQYVGFQLDGSLLANPAFNQSMNENFQTQSLCPKKQYYDSTCRIWYNLASNKNGTIMPAPFKVLTTKVPYMSLSLCRRSDAYDKLNNVACLSLNIEQVATVFSALEIQTGSFRVIHPSSESLIYDKSITDYQQSYNWKSLLTVNMTDNESSFFTKQINTILEQYQYASSEGVDISDYYSRFKLQNVKGFESRVAGDRQYCLLIPIQIVDKLNYSDQPEFTDIMMLLYMFRHDEMVKSFSEVIYFLGNIFMANSIFYLIMLIVCLLIVTFYSKKSAELIEYPISSLIQKLKSINVRLTELQILSQPGEFLVDFDSHIASRKENEHTCLELIQLEKYIQNIWEIFNYNLNFSRQIDPTAALFTCVKAIKHFQQVEDYKALGATFNNIANLHFNNHRYLEALDCFSQSIVCLESEKCQLESQKEVDELQRRAHIQNLESSPLKSLGLHFEEGKKHLVNLLPWIEKYIYKNSDENSCPGEEVENMIKQAELQLESVKFDRLFAYAGTLMACAQQNQIGNQLSKQGQCECRQDCCILILQQDEQNQQSNSEKRKRESESALLHEHLIMLKKLLRIAQNLDNDYIRFVLIYLEISKAYLLQKKMDLSLKYFDLAYRSFLEFFKRLKGSLFGQSKKPYAAVPFNSYLQQLNQILIKKFSSEEVNEEINFNRNYSPSKHFNSSMISARQARSASFICSTPPLPPLPPPLRKKSSQGVGSPSLAAIMTQSVQGQTIQPIMEDYMESQEEINLVVKDRKSSKACRQKRDEKLLESNELYKPFGLERDNSRTISTSRQIKIQLTPQSSGRNHNNNNNSLIQMRNTPPGLQASSCSQFPSSSQFFQNNNNPNNVIITNGSAITQPAGSFISFHYPQETNFTTATSNISDSNMHKVFLQTTNTMGLEDGPVAAEEAPPFSVLEQQLAALDQAASFMDFTSFNTVNSGWAQKTSFTYPVDIIFTKLQIQEALLELKRGNMRKGCNILTETFEFAPRYLPSDRMLILEMLEWAMQKENISVKSVQKQILKFKEIKLKISVIVNCDGSYLKRVSKQLYDIYALCDSFSLVVVNEQVEQYIAPINQSKFKGKENFISNIIKYLRYKNIRSNQQYFISALTKASQCFSSSGGLPDQHNILKKYVLIFGDRDCVFKDSTYRHSLFNKFSHMNVKILLFNPQDDKEGSFINISCLELHFKIRFFAKFYQLIDYLKKKSIKCPLTQPFLIEKI